MSKTIRPEDVKAIELNVRTETPGIYRTELVIPAHEVGAIIKAAMMSAEGYESFAHTADETDVYDGYRFDWLAKAEELEKMK